MRFAIAVIAALLVLSFVLAAPAYAMFSSRANVDISFGMFKPRFTAAGTGISFFHQPFRPQFQGGSFSFRFRFVDP